MQRKEESNAVMYFHHYQMEDLANMCGIIFILT